MRVTKCCAMPASYRLIAPVAIVLLLSAAVWGQMFAGLTPDELTSGRKMLKAFEPVAQPVLPATVEVHHDGERIALGLIVSADGYILTKASELGDAITCRLQGGREYDSRVVGISADHDLALLRIEADDLTPAPWREADGPMLGDLVATPGLEGPLAVGVISVKPRRIPPRSGMLGIQMGTPDEDGVPIDLVFEGSGAEEAGLRVGDVVTHIDDERVTSRQELGDAVRDRRAGDTITVRYLRDGQSRRTEAQLRANIAGIGPSRDDLMNRMGGELSARAAGFPLALQHDTVISPSQAGGPLVDLDGRVVGLNIARAGRTTTYALPASEIKSVFEMLKEEQHLIDVDDEEEVDASIEAAQDQVQ